MGCAAEMLDIKFTSLLFFGTDLITDSENTSIHCLIFMNKCSYIRSDIRYIRY